MSISFPHTFLRCKTRKKWMWINYAFDIIYKNLGNIQSIAFQCQILLHRNFLIVINEIVCQTYCKWLHFFII